jgi:PAS domain-containing protein
VAGPALTPLSVLFVSTTLERTTQFRERLAGQPAVTLDTRVQAPLEQLTRAAAERDVILFDGALGPDALGRVVTALRATPIGAALVLLVSGAELPADVVALANGCVEDRLSGEALAEALRDAAWTPWQPAAAPPLEDSSRGDLYLRVFDALPVPVIVVNQAGRITVANISASRRLAAPGEEMMIGRRLASMLAPDAAEPLAALLEAAFDGRQGRPLATTLAADDLPIALRPISLVPGADDGPELAIRCETRLRPIASARPPKETEPAAPAADSTAFEARITALDADLSALRATAAALERDLAAAAEWRREAEIAAAAAAREHAEALAALRAERDAAHEQSLALVDEIGTARAEIAALNEELAARETDADADGVEAAGTERLVRTLTSEREAAIARALQLTAERDEVLDRLDAERTRADAAIAELTALRRAKPEPVAAAAAGRARKLLAEDEPTLPAARLQRMVDDLRAELRTERELRKDLEQQLDENAEALERTIQSYESKLEAAERGAGTPARKPRKTA